MRLQRANIFSPVEGLKLDGPPSMISDKATPDCSNVRFDEGRVIKMLGGDYYAGTGAAPLSNAIMHMAYVEGEFLVHTLDKVYQYNTTTETFDDITGSTSITGDRDNIHSSSYVAALYILSNGLDKIQKWNFSGSLADLAGATSYRAKWLDRFGGRLLLLNTTESATDYPRRIRYSVVNDPENWTGQGSGYLDLHHVLRSSDEIVRSAQLGDNLIVYGSSSTGIMRYTEQWQAPFAVKTRLPETGLVAPKALANLQEGIHIFFADDNIYSFDGRSLKPIGDPIKDYLFQSVDETIINRSFMSYIRPLRRVRLFYPSVSGDGAIDTFLEYNLTTRKWSRGKRSYTSFVIIKKEETDTWDSLSDTTWNQMGKTWNDTKTSGESPIPIYGSSGGEVIKEDESVYDLAGEAIEGYWTTKDFTSGEDYRAGKTDWLELRFEGEGHSVDVQYKDDTMSHYETLETVNMKPDEWEEYKVDFRLHSETVRFRFYNNSSNETFSLKWLSVGFIPRTR